MADHFPDRAAVPALGKLPDCVGYYQAGHKECDDAPCPWRVGCQLYRIWAEARAESFGISPEQYIEGESKSLPRKARALMIREIMRAQPDSRPAHRPRHLQGWQRFLDTFVDTDPGVPVMPSERTAQDGELYVRPWHDAHQRGPTVYNIRVKGTKRDRDRADLTVFKYRLGIKSRIQPTLEIRAPLRALFDRFPKLERAAFRWRGCAKGEGPAWRKRAKRNLGAMAVGIYSERIEDFGRACAHLLKEGIIPGMTVHNRRVICTEEALNWRP